MALSAPLRSRAGLINASTEDVSARAPAESDGDESPLVDRASSRSSPSGAHAAGGSKSRGTLRQRLLTRTLAACFPCLSCFPLRRGGGSRRGCGTRDHHALWLNKDPCGVVTALAVHAIVYSCYALCMDSVLLPAWGDSVWGWLIIPVWTALGVLGLVSHGKAMLSNPGAVPAHAKPVDPSDASRTCARCASFKPARAHHCGVCGRCVMKMDHHCPWINNCVGMANQKYFILFLVYICTFCIYGLSFLGVHVWHCMSPAADASRCAAAEPRWIIEWVLCVTFGVLFSLFTGCLFIDQLTVINTNQTQIDRLKASSGRSTHTAGDAALREDVDDRLRVWRNLGEIFGGDPVRDGWQWSWLVPTSITYPNPEALTGYCFRDVPRPRTEAEMEMV